jgi:hypothetical protein
VLTGLSNLHNYFCTASAHTSEASLKKREKFFNNQQSFIKSIIMEADEDRIL